jgi:hypothetical protein
MVDENQNNGGTTDSANQSNGDQSANGQDGTQNNPQFVTIEMLNKALSGYNKRVESKFAEHLTTGLAPIHELLSKIGGTSEDQNNGDTAGQGQGQGQNQAQAQDNKELLKLQKQLSDLQNQLQTEKADKEKVAKQAQDQKVKSEVLSTLTSLKVEKGEQVYQLVRDNIVIDDNGRIQMKTVDKTLGFEDVVDLSKGLTDWLNDNGTHFLPPRNLGGSGANNNTGGGNDNRQITNLKDLNNMKPSELAKVDLRKALPEGTLEAFFNTNQ